MRKRCVGIFTTVLIVLVIVNAAFLVIAIRANRGAARAFEERHAIISAIYESSIAGGAFTRLARYYAVTGNNAIYQLFREEAERNRYGQTLNTLKSFGATEQEIELLNNVTEQRLLLFDILQETLRLRQEGFIDEAISLAHGEDIARIGMPAGPMSDEVRDLVIERTSGIAAEHRCNAEFFGNLNVIFSIMLVLGGVFWLIAAGKIGMPRRVEIFGAVFLLLATANMFFSISANKIAREKLNNFEEQYVLINTTYNAERGTEILTRLSRMYVIAGGEAQYNLYLAELERDRFGHALETFISMNAKPSEINVLVDVLNRLTRLRQIEAQSILLRSTGYFQEAIETAFGPEVAALDRPLGILGEELRETVNTRAERIINARTRSYNAFVFITLIAALLLAATGFAKLFVIKNTRQEAAPGILAFTFRRISDMAIRTKLLASFAIMIIIFIVQIGLNAYLHMGIHQLNRYNTDFLIARSDILWRHYQEFTEMRRLLRETFLNHQWIENANQAEWISTERRLSASHTRLTNLAEAYVSLIRTDPVILMAYDDSRIVMLSEVMAHIDTIYQLYRTNFFLSGNMSLYSNNVMDYAGSAEVMIQMLRQFVNVNLETTERRIEHLKNLSTRITVISLVIVVVLALLLTFFIQKTFTGRIKTIEATADKLAQGDFEAGLQLGNDEISATFSKAMEAFTRLISEINHATNECKKGNTGIRINTGRFRGGHKKAALAINTLLDSIEKSLSDLREAKNKANQAAMAKGAFLSNMSHEIRTPMNAIVGMAAIGKLTNEIERKNYALNKIEDASAHLLAIINDVLDMSKIESGKFELSLSKFHFSDMIWRVASVISFRVEEKNQYFEINIDENIPPTLIGNEHRLAQVITNLVGNAVKFTPHEGRIDLNARLLKEENKICTIQVEVIDNGIGISPEQQVDLFQPFHQVETDAARKFEGTGLGLSICKNIIGIMGGRIWVESKLGEGAAFIFTVEMKRADEAGKYPDTSWQKTGQNGKKPFSLSDKCILLVEDIVVNREIVIALLEQTEIKIECAENGKQAVDMFTQAPEKYELIFMDVQMPEMDGYEATRRIRLINHSKAKTIPIIAMTAYTFREDVERCLNAGMNDHIGKPLDFNQLMEKLRQYLR